MTLKQIGDGPSFLFSATVTSIQKLKNVDRPHLTGVNTMKIIKLLLIVLVPALLVAFDVRNGDIVWETRLGTSVQGHPVSFAIDGKQYIAVTTALGGTSPRTVPGVIAPEISYPANGNALYVFALPD